MKSNPKGGNTLDQIKQLELKRQERRKQMEEMKKQKQQRKALNLERGKNVDIDFQLMIEKNKFKDKLLQPHTSSSSLKLSVCVRKRPLFKKQEQNGQIDAISCANPKIKIHQPKFKVDGITKYIDNHLFTFDNTFNEEETGDDIYKYALHPLIPILFQDGIVTCFAYGQTGSGKTFTMNGVQEKVVNQLYNLATKQSNITVSFFEIYGGRCYDLLNEKNPLNILEDKNNNIQIQGLVEKQAVNPKQLFGIMQSGNSIRTTHATVSNDTSSRSHSICQITVRKGDYVVGKLVLVDLAGSERAQDTQSNNRQRRIQGAQINKSLLALKQCIRAMGDGAQHVPFRASKLTLVLRDSFINKSNNCKVVMIACISPGSSSADHSLNTLRYADRLKDRAQGAKISEIQQSKQQFDQLVPKSQQSKEIKKEQPKLIQKQKETPQSKPNVPINKVQKPQKPVIKNERIQPPQKVQKKPQYINKDRNTSMDKKKSNKDKQKQQQIDKQIQQRFSKIPQSKIRDDVSVMKQTLRQKDQDFFNFHQKVSNILDEQEQIFATHMTVIKEDAKLLTEQSQLMSSMQGDGYMDNDIDTYVQKLQKIIKKKLKIYSLLGSKLELFKNNLRQEDEISKKVKDTKYY